MLSSWKETKKVFLFGILIRWISSLTYAHWFHPDEWCQTLEPANLIAHGIAFHSQEIGLHLRNLSWPLLLAGLLKLIHTLDSNSIDFRIFSIHLFCGLLDLGILWGWIQLLKSTPDLKFISKKAKNWSFALLLLPWFTIYPSINPRGEHLSEIAFWLTMGFRVNEWWILAGISSVALFAFRYPSILLTLGIGISVLLSWQNTKKLSILTQYLAGLAIGVLVFGIGDWIYYGRPWESFWMYLQYNIFTGSSVKAFGHQGIQAYQEIFLWNWSTYSILIPFGILLFLSMLIGFWKGIKTSQCWAICFIIYLAGHLFTPHKEGRFMAPIETLTRWSAFYGLILISNYFQSFRIPRVLGNLSLWIIVGLNGFIFLHHLRGDLWKPNGTYTEVGLHLRSHPHICGILTSRFMNSTLLPFQTKILFPNPAVGIFNNKVSYQDFNRSKLSWVEHSPFCQKDGTLLLHLEEAEPAWDQLNCTLLPSGFLRVIPKFAWNWAIHRRFAKGSWYECPSSLLQKIPDQRVVHQYSYQFGKISSLPRYGISAKELEELGLKTSPPPIDSVLPSLK